MKRTTTFKEAAKAQACQALATVQVSVNECLTNEKGQGTTEYAILVGVLVVIAILAISMFRPALEQLWSRITDGINSL